MVEISSYYDYVEVLLGEEIKKSNDKLVRKLSLSQLAKFRQENLNGHDRLHEYIDK